MMGALSRAGYPQGVLGQRDRRGGGHGHPDPAVDRAHHLFRAGAAGDSVPALFAAGMIPGILAGVALLVPIFWLSTKHGFGLRGEGPAAAAVLAARLREAIWGLMAPVLILGGMRAGWFTPTEAAVVAVVYGLFVGFVIYRSLTLRDVYEMLVESAEITGIILIIVALASIFAWAGSTLGVFDQARASVLVAFGGNEYIVLALLIVLLIVIGMFLDGVSTFLILLPLLMPIANSYGWDPVWFGILITHEGGDRPVHAADGGQPDGVVPRSPASPWRRRCAGCFR